MTYKIGAVRSSWHKESTTEIQGTEPIQCRYSTIVFNNLAIYNLWSLKPNELYTYGVLSDGLNIREVQNLVLLYTIKNYKNKTNKRKTYSMGKLSRGSSKEYISFIRINVLHLLLQQNNNNVCIAVKLRALSSLLPPTKNERIPNITKQLA